MKTGIRLLGIIPLFFVERGEDMRPYCTAVIMAAGKGKRMGTDISKQFLPVCGREILAWTVAKFEASPAVDEIILMAGTEGIEEVRELCTKYGWKKVCQVALGGKERQNSVANGLRLLSEKTEIVLIHDGVRPFVTEEMIETSIEGALRCGGCVVGVPAKDTIKICDSDQMAVETPDRNTLWQIQTPQTFRREEICAAYRKAAAEGFLGTDDASVSEYVGGRVYVAMGDYRNIKITTKEDLLIAEAFLREEEA